ncbi:hypothetical protein BDV28DRAFT_141039 [Aspergillus coremiiformis]|uniref:3-oxo-5-alpha-steroid 4-dehydrogenase C-terminal domain-containing protein n=1 Tax=Aspergillus coremiiformis TaxID=138285 RepID=A0A5N6YVN0_9EURO|nr:hypothetical protein BDV28DRAFT_141039 [Aspergillus coremiiformis]
MGKTSLKTSPLNIPGRLAWSGMELIGPLNLLYQLNRLPNPNTTLPLPNKITASLYLIHYANRAIISPLLAAPSISPIHASIVCSAAAFNWVNSTCLAAWLVGYHVPVPGFRTDGSEDGDRSAIATCLPYLGFGLFFLGMVGNIVAERTLFRLRREEADKLECHRRHQQGKKLLPRNRYSKVYVLPPASGLFRFILYPHYVCEWLEWIGFVLVGTAVYPAVVAPEMKLAPWLVPAAAVVERLRVPLPLPAVVFVGNIVASMVPQARWGKKWYLGKFGRERVAGRAAVLPFSSWL